MVQTDHINTPTPQLSAHWRRLTAATQAAIITTHCCQPIYRNCEFVSIKGPMVEVRITGKLETGAIGSLLRDLEKYLRNCTGEPLEVYCQGRVDQNKPRSPVQRQKIKAWLSTREAMKKQAADEK